MRASVAGSPGAVSLLTSHITMGGHTVSYYEVRGGVHDHLNKEQLGPGTRQR